MNYKLKQLLFYFLGGIIIGVVLFYISRSYYDYRNYKEELRNNIVYWKSIAGEHPNYPDSWVKLAINWEKLDKDRFAELAIKKAAGLDPINDEIKEIQEKLKD